MTIFPSKNFNRAGILKFTFPKTDCANIMLDLAPVLQWKILAPSVRIENDSMITGYHLVKGWAKERYIYFAAIFSRKSQTTAMNPGYGNIMRYVRDGYVSYDLEPESVSKTLEYVYDDVCKEVKLIYENKFVCRY